MSELSTQQIISVSYLKGDITGLQISPYVSEDLSADVLSSLKDIMVAITNESGRFRISLELSVSTGDE